MPVATETEMGTVLEELQAQMAEIARRISELEKGKPLATPPLTAMPKSVPAPPAITEDELVAISAAIGAFLGVRAHIRQIRLLSTTAWAQQGRVSIQASHTLQA